MAQQGKSSKTSDNSKPKATMPLTVMVRTCNCVEPAIPDNLLRKLMELQDPRIKRFNTEPCDHWQKRGIDLLKISPDAKSRTRGGAKA